MDRQLKVRGFRVEPGEIESVLAGHPDIDQVSVVAHRAGAGRQRLVAYYTPTRAAAQATCTPAGASLRRYLLARLPGYMIPAAFVAARPDAAGARAGTGTSDAGASGRSRAQRPAAGASGRAAHAHAGRAVRPVGEAAAARTTSALTTSSSRSAANSLLAAEMLAHTGAMFGIGADSVRPLTRCLLRDPTLRGFARAAEDARAGRLAHGRRPGRGRLRPRERSSAPVRGAVRHPAVPRGRTGADRGRCCSPGRPGSSARTCSASCSPATCARVWCLVRARDAAHGRQRLATPPPGTTSAGRGASAWCRCPVTWPRRGSGLSPGEGSASWPGALTSSTTRARR